MPPLTHTGIRTIAPAVLVLLSLILPVSSHAQVPAPFPRAHELGTLSMTGAAAWRPSLHGFENPALLAWQRELDLAVTWTAPYSDGRMDRLGMFVGLPSLGFGAIEHSNDTLSVTDFRLGFATGGKEVSFGVAFGWSNGDVSQFGRQGVFSTGLLIRPAPGFSLGTWGVISNDGRRNEWTVDAAIRPFGNDRLTVFADYSKRDGQGLADGRWSAGAIVEPLRGIRVSGRYFDDESIAAGVQLSLGRIGAQMVSTITSSGEHGENAYTVRMGANDYNAIDLLRHRREFVTVDLRGELGYQRYVLFDSRRTLGEVLEWIRTATADDAVRGIALNTSGSNASRAMLWELRDQLRQFRARGKRVVVFIDRPDIGMYHLASVADRIVLDPSGMIALQGFVSGRSFYKGSLEKAGIGYDEWRFFTHKSAYEQFSRTAMSDADRQQRQEFLDDLYAEARNDIAASRRVPPDTVDAWINTRVMFMANEALRLGLVDTLGRWDEIEGIASTLEGGASLIPPSAMDAYTLPLDRRWGGRPKIGVVYALGACAMDEGINARSLVNDVQQAINRPDIRAVVLRVDSPGGDAMASDYISAVLKKARGRKPIIVSQGAVAASGGYWLSMYADTIVAAPVTLTGSIGVIGGWFYNAGLKETLGITTDLVKAGAHADIGFPFTLPLLGLGLPDRNLSSEERDGMERMIRAMYDEFVGKVAEGRGMTTAAVDAVGQGRIWSGKDGKEKGLVDELGGLADAIRIAVERAGLDASEEYEIVSWPQPGLINFGALLPRFIGISDRSPDRVLDDLLFRIRNNGLPMPLMPMDDGGTVTLPQY